MQLSCETSPNKRTDPEWFVNWAIWRFQPQRWNVLVFNHLRKQKRQQLSPTILVDYRSNSFHVRGKTTPQLPHHCISSVMTENSPFQLHQKRIKMRKKFITLIYNHLNQDHHRGLTGMGAPSSPHEKTLTRY